MPRHLERIWLLLRHWQNGADTLKRLAQDDPYLDGVRDGLKACSTELESALTSREEIDEQVH